MSFVREFWKAIRRGRVLRYGVVLSLLMVLVALLAPVIANHSPTEMHRGQRLSAPSRTYFFGTDEYGRDIFSRVVYGSRVSVLVGLTVAVMATLLGGVAGLVSGYFGRLDPYVMRLMDAMMAIPAIILAMGIVAVLGPGMSNAMFALAIVETPLTARLVRSVVLPMKELDYVVAARAAGCSQLRILARHILPTCISPLLINGSFVFAVAVQAEATLSFLGLGVSPPTPTWGNIAAEGLAFIRQASWYVLMPGVALALMVFGLNMLGDGLRDELDPKQRTRMRSRKAAGS